MSDRIAVMNEGHIEHLGSPRNIYEHPATKFVAGFIGTSNLLGGVVSRVVPGSDGNNAILSTSADERIVVPLRGGSDAAIGSTIELTVRPEKIELRTAAPATSNGSVLSGTVTEVVYLGTSTNYNVTTSTGSDVVVFLQNTSSADDLAARGDAVWLTWDPQHSYAIGATSL
jgi:spermidine/putrescine transport system ATP-binding protein